MTKKISWTLCLAALTSLTQVSFARNFSDSIIIGNGGDAIVCRDKSTEAIVSAEILDVYEARVIHNAEITVDPSQSTDDILNTIIGKIRLKETVSADRIQSYVDTFFEEAKFLNDIELEDINDSAHIIIPRGCKVEQVAVHNKPSEFNPNRYTVNNNIWNSLDNLNKAALVLHEVLYRIARESLSIRDSRLIRLSMASLLSFDFEQDFVKFLNLLNRLGFDEAQLSSLPNLKIKNIKFSGSEITAYRATVVDQERPVDVFTYSLKLTADDSIDFQKNKTGLSSYQINFSEGEEDATPLNIGNGNILNTNAVFVKSYVFSKMTPQVDPTDTNSSSVQIKIYSKENVENRLNGRSYLFTHDGSRFFRDPQFLVSQSTVTQKITQIMASNELTANGQILEKCEDLRFNSDLSQGALCLSDRPDQNTSTFFRQATHFTQDLELRTKYILRSKTFQKIDHWESGHVKQKVTKTVDPSDDHSEFKELSESFNFDLLQTESGDYSFQKIEDSFQALEDFADVSEHLTEVCGGGSSCDIVIKNTDGIPESHLHTSWRSANDNQKFFRVPYLSTLNTKHYEDGTPWFNVPQLSPIKSIPAVAFNPNGDMTEVDLPVMRYSALKETQVKKQISSVTFSRLILPYLEYFPNGQIKYLLAGPQRVTSSHYHLYKENGDLVRVNTRDFLIFNEQGVLVESFAIDTYYGAIRAGEIRNQQVEEYGFFN